MSGKMNLAGFWVRFGAYILDAILLGIVSGLLFGNQAVEPGSFEVGYSGWQTLITVAYFIGFWIWKGQTPGYMALKLKVVDEKGGQINPGTAVIRYIMVVVGAAVLGLGHLWIAFDPKKQGWHDKVAKTHVIKM